MEGFFQILKEFELGMKVLLKSKNWSTLVNTLGYDSSRDYKVY